MRREEALARGSYPRFFFLTAGRARFWRVVGWVELFLWLCVVCVGVFLALGGLGEFPRGSRGVCFS